MCRFEIPDGGTSAVRECDRAGDLLSCQLCPHSNTGGAPNRYWRDYLHVTPRAADRPPDDLPRLNNQGILNWRSDSPTPATIGPMRPCQLCGQLTQLISPAGKPCHKTCAEQWLRDHPKAAGHAPDQLH